MRVREGKTKKFKVICKERAEGFSEVNNHKSVQQAFK
jgi:6,7-dimethyl-8-ribityllumazine synthase